MRIFSTQASANMHKHKAKMRGGSAGALGGFPKSRWDFVFVGRVDLLDSDSRCGLLDCVKLYSRISERGSAEWIKTGALHEMLV